MIIALLKRDLRLAVRRSGDLLSHIGFFLMIATLFPLAIGPAPDLLSAVRSAILWIAVLLAAIPSFDKLFADDYDTGFLDQLVIRRLALWEYALVRIFSHFVIMGGPLLLCLPFLAVFFAIDASHLLVLIGILAIGLLSLTFLGAIAASLTLGARRSGLLSAVLILPLAFPILIFGTLASQAVLDQTDYSAHFALLGAVTLFLAVISPAATFYALRIAIEER